MSKLANVKHSKQSLAHSRCVAAGGMKEKHGVPGAFDRAGPPSGDL